MTSLLDKSFEILRDATDKAGEILDSRNSEGNRGVLSVAEAITSLGILDPAVATHDKLDMTTADSKAQAALLDEMWEAPAAPEVVYDSIETPEADTVVADLVTPPYVSSQPIAFDEDTLRRIKEAQDMAEAAHRSMQQ